MSLPADIAANPKLSTWFALEADGRVVFRTGKVELGQGAVTAIAALAAAELTLQPEALTVVAGDTRSGPDEGLTASSLSIEQGGAAARHAAGVLRERLAEAAARRLGVPVAALHLADGRFSVSGQNLSLGFSDLAGDLDMEADMRRLPVPEPVSDWAQAVPLRRRDLPARLSGPAFVHDLVRHDMRHGRVLRPPHPGAVLEAADRAALAALPGVDTVVIDGGFVGIVAADEYTADRAASAGERHLRWRLARRLPPCEPDQAWLEDVAPHLVETLLDEADAGVSLSAPDLAATFARPFIAHAAIAPSCAVAEWQDNRLTVWAHSQGPFLLAGALARALDLPEEAVAVVHSPGAGAYGHNGADDVALDAALLARAAGAPVMVRWSRRDEMVWAPRGPAMRIRLAAKLDHETGRIAAWSSEVFSPPHLGRPQRGLAAPGVDLLAAWSRARPVPPAPPRSLPGPGTGDRNAIPGYAVGARRIRHNLLPQGTLRTSALRALGAHANVFAIEGFMDELAALAGADPLEFRLRHLDDDRGRGILEIAAGAAGWDGRPAGGDGHGMGIGYARYKNTGAWCAVVAEVVVETEIRLIRLVAAVDCGAVVHRDGALNQIEGGVLQAASWTLIESLSWDADGVIGTGWDSYPVLGFAKVPAVDVHLAHRPASAPLGAGECATGPTTAAIANAAAAALGVRLRRLPLTPSGLRAAIDEI